MKFASATLDDSCTHHLGHKSTSRATLVTALLCLGLFVVPATAKTVTVNCVGSTINAALKTLDPKADNTVRVIGSCNESIGVNGFADLTILGVNAGGKIPMILPPDGTAAFWIVASHVQIQNLTIHGGLWGAMCREFSVCRFSNNIIENATGRGAELDSADATFQGDVIQNNADDGLYLTASRVRLTNVTVTGTQAGPWDDGKGVALNQSSTITIEQLAVQNNQGAGVSLIGDSSLTNRSYTGPFTVMNNANGGVWVTTASSAILSGATVTNNNYGGVIITGNSEAEFWGGGTFSGDDL